MNSALFPKKGKEKSKPDLQKSRKLVEYNKTPSGSIPSNDLPSDWFYNETNVEDIWNSIEKKDTKHVTSRSGGDTLVQIDESATRIRKLLQNYELTDHEFVLSVIDVLNNDPNITNVDQYSVLVDAKLSLQGMLNSHQVNSEDQSKLLDSLRSWFSNASVDANVDSEVEVSKSNDGDKNIDVNKIAEFITQCLKDNENCVEAATSIHHKIIDSYQTQVNDLMRRINEKNSEILTLRRDIEVLSSSQQKTSKKRKEDQNSLERVNRKIVEQGSAINSLKNAIEKMRSDEKSNEDEIAKSDLSASTDKEIELEMKIRVLTEELSVLKKERGDLDNELKEANTNITALEEKVITLERLRKSLEIALSSQEEKNNLETEQIRKKIDEQKSACENNKVEDDHTNDPEYIRASYEQKLIDLKEEMRQSYMESVGEVEAKYKKQLEALTKNFNDQDSDSGLSALIENHRSEIEAIKNENIKYNEEMKLLNMERIANVKKEYELKINNLKEEHKQSLDDIKEDYENALTKQKMDIQEKLRIQLLEEQNDQDSKTLETRQKLNNQIAKLKRQVRRLMTERNALRAVVGSSGDVIDNDMGEEDDIDDCEPSSGDFDTRSVIEEAKTEIRLEYERIMHEQKENYEKLSEANIQKLKSSLENSFNKRLIDEKLGIAEKLVAIKELLRNEVPQEYDDVVSYLRSDAGGSSATSSDALMHVSGEESGQLIGTESRNFRKGYKFQCIIQSQNPITIIMDPNFMQGGSKICSSSNKNEPTRGVSELYSSTNTGTVDVPVNEVDQESSDVTGSTMNNIKSVPLNTHSGSGKTTTPSVSSTVGDISNVKVITSDFSRNIDDTSTDNSTTGKVSFVGSNGVIIEMGTGICIEIERRSSPLMCISREVFTLSPPLKNPAIQLAEAEDMVKILQNQLKIMSRKQNDKIEFEEEIQYHEKLLERGLKIIKTPYHVDIFASDIEGLTETTMKMGTNPKLSPFLQTLKEKQASLHEESLSLHSAVRDLHARNSEILNAIKKQYLDGLNSIKKSKDVDVDAIEKLEQDAGYLDQVVQERENVYSENMMIKEMNSKLSQENDVLTQRITAKDNEIDILKSKLDSFMNKTMIDHLKSPPKVVEFEQDGNNKDIDYTYGDISGKLFDVTEENRMLQAQLERKQSELLQLQNKQIADVVDMSTFEGVIIDPFVIFSTVVECSAKGFSLSPLDYSEANKTEASLDSVELYSDDKSGSLSKKKSKEKRRVTSPVSETFSESDTAKLNMSMTTKHGSRVGKVATSFIGTSVPNKRVAATPKIDKKSSSVAQSTSTKFSSAKRLPSLKPPGVDDRATMSQNTSSSPQFQRYRPFVSNNKTILYVDRYIKSANDRDTAHDTDGRSEEQLRGITGGGVSIPTAYKIIKTSTSPLTVLKNRVKQLEVLLQNKTSQYLSVKDKDSQLHQMLYKLSSDYKKMEKEHYKVRSTSEQYKNKLQNSLSLIQRLTSENDELKTLLKIANEAEKRRQFFERREKIEQEKKKILKMSEMKSRVLAQRTRYLTSGEMKSFAQRQEMMAIRLQRRREEILNRERERTLSVLRAVGLVSDNEFPIVITSIDPHNPGKSVQTNRPNSERSVGPSHVTSKSVSSVQSHETSTVTSSQHGPVLTSNLIVGVVGEPIKIIREIVN